MMRSMLGSAEPCIQWTSQLALEFPALVTNWLFLVNLSRFGLAGGSPEQPSSSSKTKEVGKPSCHEGRKDVELP